ncbi:MAG: MATE family efflux transporter [Oscillospiraceae bacterium]|jgi:putative MATE family efflux protein|nr:MATE family efflux transporter [Oscillospiraceae bacterium]
MNTFFRRFTDGTLFPWERDFTKEALNVAVPIVIHSLFASLLHIIDNVMIGQLGELELAAVTQANRITFLFQMVLFGLAGGTATYAAQFWGKRDLAGIRRVLGLALCVALLAALLFLIPSLLMPGTLMGLLLKEADAAALAATYLPIIAVGYLLQAVTQCFSTVQKSTEQTKLSMVGGIASLLVNTGLNYCLIFGRLGFPRLGVRGGALATVIALAVEMSIIVGMGYRLRFASAARLSELVPRSAAFAKKYMAVALPVVLNEGLWSLGMVMYSAVYGRIGTSAVAAISIFNTVEQVAFSTMRGLTGAAAVMIGKRIGAGDEDAAQHTARRFLWASIPSGLFAGALLLLVSAPLLSLFNVSPAVAADARGLVRVCALFLWLSQLGGLLVVGIMRSGGDVQMSLYLDAGSAWVIGVPMVALAGLVLRLPLPIIFLMAQSENITKVGLGLLRFRSRKWIHNLVR